MADEQQKPIRTFSLNWMERIKRVVGWAEGAMRTVSARKRTPQPWITGGSTTNSSTSDGASCGCCDPTNCAHYLQPLSNDDDCPEGPFGWEVNFGNSITLGQLCQNLTKDSEGNFELEYVGYGVWRSESFTCNGEAVAGGCNASGSGTCTEIRPSPGSCTGDSEWIGVAGSPNYWQLVSADCSAGCTPTGPGGIPSVGQEGTGSCAPNLNDIEAACIWYPDGAGGWTLADDSLCPCGCGDPPEFESSETYQGGYNTACAESGTGSVESGTQYSWIQLTTDNTRDADGRSNTKLELIVGGVAAFTFRPRIGFDWCCSCENKLELQCCGPFAFKFIPESVCVKPMAPSDFDDKYVDAPDGWACCAPYFTDAGEEIPKLPKYVMIEVAASESGCPDGTCCEQASGMFVLEWDAFAGGWVYRFPPACDGTTTPFPQIEACNNTVCAVPVGVFGPHLWLDYYKLYCSDYGDEPVFFLELHIINSEPIETPECTPPTCNVNFCFNSYGLMANQSWVVRDPSKQCFREPVAIGTNSSGVLCDIGSATAVALI